MMNSVRMPRSLQPLTQKVRLLDQGLLARICTWASEVSVHFALHQKSADQCTAAASVGRLLRRWGDASVVLEPAHKSRYGTPKGN